MSNRIRLQRPLIQVGTSLPQGGGGSFAEPDLRIVTINATGAGAGFDDIALVGFPYLFIGYDPTGGVGGSGCVVANIPGDEQPQYAPSAIVAYPRRSAVYCRMSLRCESPAFVPGGNVKGPMYFHDSVAAGNSASLYSDMTWYFAWEAGGGTVATGIHWGTQPAGEAAYGIVPTIENMADDTYHTVEVYYNRDFGPYVYAQIWVDGIPVILPEGDSYAFLGAYPDVQYVGGNLAADEPTRIQAVRNDVDGGLYHDFVSFFETLSQPNPGGVIRGDNFLVSSQRIGPYYQP